jgi:hypothetical protein
MNGLTRYACVAAAMILAPQPAMATPETVIDIREEPFAASQTHLFVIRTTGDNLGLYEVLRTESFLIARSFATGAEEVWVLDKFVRRADYDETGEPAGFVSVRDEGVEPVNPFLIAYDRGAVPFAALRREPWAPPSIRQTAEGIGLTFPDGSVFKISSERLANRLRHLREAVAAQIADHPRHSLFTTRGIFAQRRIKPSSCRVNEVLDYWGPDTFAQHRLLRLLCDDGEELGVTSLVVKLDRAASQ